MVWGELQGIAGSLGGVLRDFRNISGVLQKRLKKSWTGIPGMFQGISSDLGKEI